MIQDELETLLVRRCKICKVTKPLERFGGESHVHKTCASCTRRNDTPAPPTFRGMIARARGITITREGYADLSQWKREIA